MKQENIDKILKEYKLDSIEDLYLNIGNGKYSVKYIIKEVYAFLFFFDGHFVIPS